MVEVRSEREACRAVLRSSMGAVDMSPEGVVGSANSLPRVLKGRKC